MSKVLREIKKEVIDEWDKAVLDSKSVGNVLKAVFTRLESIEQRLSYIEQRRCEGDLKREGK